MIENYEQFKIRQKFLKKKLSPQKTGKKVKKNDKYKKGEKFQKNM